MNYYCGFCGSTKGFASIEEDLGSQLHRYNFKYSLKDFETLSYKKYKCTKCGSSDRDRLYKLFLDTYELPETTEKILDFAPSKPFEDYMRGRYTRYTTADLLIESVDDRVDITNMSAYADGTYDFFICSHVLEHVDDDAKALSELFRVLKSGHRGILMTPVIDKSGVQDEDPKLTNEAERWRRFAQGDHVRLYEKQVFLERVKAAGFNIKVFGYWNLNPIKLYQSGVSLKSRLYVVNKLEKANE